MKKDSIIGRLTAMKEEEVRGRFRLDHLMETGRIKRHDYDKSCIESDEKHEALRMSIAIISACFDMMEE